MATNGAANISDAIAALPNESLAALLDKIAGAGATKIADAIAALPAESLKTLTEALSPVFPEGTAPADTANSIVPTTVVGDRTALLGKPTGWVSINGKNVPTF